MKHTLSLELNSDYNYGVVLIVKILYHLLRTNLLCVSSRYNIFSVKSLGSSSYSNGFYGTCVVFQIQQLPLLTPSTRRKF